MKQRTAPKHLHARPKHAMTLRAHVNANAIHNAAAAGVGRRGLTHGTWRLATCTDVTVSAPVAVAFAPYHQRPKEMTP